MKLHNPVLAFVLCALFTFSASQRGSAADPYAKAVVFSLILNGNVGNSSPNVTNALGAPNNQGVSLGGPGASIMLDMGETTPITDGPGPDLEVREIGAAYGGVDERYRVLVSNSTDTNTFIYVGEGKALTLIDISPAGLASARYVWLQDLATETLNTQTPGCDIDSLRVLRYTGGDDDVDFPSGVKVRMTGQGAWLSWAAATATNVTGYAIRRSLDGLSFGSSPDATLSAQEAAWHDTSLPVVGPLYYAVSTLAGASESALAIVAVAGRELPLLTNEVVHLGDDTISGWADPSPQRDLTLTFSLPDFAEGPQAEISLDLWDVDDSGNAVLLNGGRIANMPTQGAASWVAKSIRFPAGALQPGLNTLVLSARNSSGGTTGALDDYQVRNIKLSLYGTQPDISLITGARFISVSPDEPNVTLRWVVEQTPSLSPLDWQTVSDPIEWTGTITPSNGFFRLRNLP